MSKTSSRFSRRDILSSAATLAAAAVLAPPFSQPLEARPRFATNPFMFGVASGDPLPDGVVLWTRLGADLEDAETWGLAEPSYKLWWALYDAEAPGRAVAQGDAVAAREKGYAVHVEAGGLQPGHRYTYRFWCGDEESPLGLTKTAPPPGLDAKLRFGFCSCAEYENEFFHAYRAMAEADLDFAVHLGDYIYESAYEHFRIKFGRPTARRLRYDRYTDAMEPIRIASLGQFRRRYAEYRMDADLAEAHRVMPWIVTWDDHEVDNDYAALTPLKGDAAEFAAKRKNGYQAYFENMPIRLSALPVVGDARQLYRRFDFGKLLRLHVLDERQYRDAQACKPGGVLIDPAQCPDLAAERHMLGAQQLDWLKDGLANSPALWNVLAQGIMFTPADARVKDEEPLKVWHDAWSAYPWAQGNVMSLLEQNGAKNPVFITGDIHSHWVTKVRRRGADGKWGPTLAPEFVGTAISSGLNDRPDAERRNDDVVVFHNGKRHGYCLVEASAAEFKTTMVMMAKDAREPEAKPIADHSWAYKVEPGKRDPVRV
ncbi:MAG: alkaline phosphatase D family protein [Hyphomicrobiales bacterium]|nr:alkaline phosphatase D family protein [Hyphomicrobiales bacterium]